jgi:hypothetical protein
MQIGGRTLSHETSETIRHLAVRRVKEGERPSSVIKSYGMCRTTTSTSGCGPGVSAGGSVTYTTLVLDVLEVDRFLKSVPVP